MSTLNRRAVLGAAAVLPGLTSVASATETPIAELWKQARALEKADWSSLDEDAVAARLFELEERVLVGPIRSREDAIAKLCAAGLTCERGYRIDGLDEPAYHEAVKWLEAH